MKAIAIYIHLLRHYREEHAEEHGIRGMGIIGSAALGENGMATGLVRRHKNLKEA
jgi:hypothetical protein